MTRTTELRAWRGPAFLPHPGWPDDGRWLNGFRFEAPSLADAIQQAEYAYGYVRPGAQVELAKDEADFRAAIDAFIDKKSNVLKILPI